MKWIRHIFGLKELVHRDRAASQFLAHIRAESDSLKRNLIPALTEVCGAGKMPRIQSVLERPWVRFEEGRFQFGSKTLLDAHCFAIAAVHGLAAIRDHIDPRHQSTGMLWTSHRLITAEDVGEENVGHAPSSRPRPDMHVLYRPGSFTGGIPSQQQALVERYQSLRSVPDQLVLLLLSLRLIEPSLGVGKAVFTESELAPGIVGRNRIGILQPAPYPVDEWEADIVITDADAALSGVPGAPVAEMKAALRNVDAFWPDFSRAHRLTW